MSAKKMLLFDIDGTLLLTGGAGKIAFERIFLEMFNLPDVWGELIPDGKTDPVIIAELAERVLKRPLSAEEYQDLCVKYLEYFEYHLERVQRFRLMPGIQTLIPSLAKREDLVLGVATGNFEKASRLKLKRAGLDGYFGFGGFGSDSKNRTELTRKAVERGEERTKRDFRREDIFMIGDTVYDIQAGKDLGIRTVAVATGSTPYDVLNEKKPDYIFRDLSDEKLFLKTVFS